ncbi:hypothetical protein EJ110_NYTH15951 [Nymphaea thermarum]|nr:hypothetical protein EJ110_NYTH15951 [Nymphaea thermarum]
MDLKSSKKAKGVSHQPQHHQHGGRKPEANKPTKKKAPQNRYPSRTSPTQPTLPSNWDRYEEEGDEMGEYGSGSPFSQTPKQEIVVPKSKGADYSYLISEAQSLPRGVPSFHEVLLQDFSQGMSSMLSARGKGFLSLGADDNFHVDDSPLDHEASFFSLDLHLVAEQLAKLEPSKRLFVEEDILPASMRPSGFKASINDESKNVELSRASESEHGQQPLAGKICCPEDTHLHDAEHMSVSSRDSQEDEVLKQNRHDLKCKTVEGQGVAHNPTNVSFLEQSYQIKSILHTKDDASKSREEQDDASQSIQDMPTSRFDATTAEAELDTLLDSFDEAKLLDSFDIKQQFPGRSAGTSASSRSTESSRSVLGGASLGSTYRAPNQMLLMKSLDLTNEGPDKKMLPKVAPSIVNNESKGDKSENAPLVSLDDFDEWLDSI